MMVTLTIDGRERTFGALVKVSELYARAGLHPANCVLRATDDILGDDLLDDLARVLRYPACPYRTFVSEAR